MNEYIKVNPIGGGASLSPTGNYTVNSLDLIELILGSGPKFTVFGGTAVSLDGDGAGNGELGASTSLTLYADLANTGMPYLTLAQGGGIQLVDSVTGQFEVLLNNLTCFKVDSTVVAGNTSLQLFDPDSGLTQRVKVTANNAVLGVTGRVLYVDNI
jgi:hypothetical protein